MPPKNSEEILAYVGWEVGEGGYEYVGNVEHIDFTDGHTMHPYIGEDMYSYFCKSHPDTTRIGWVAVTEAIWHGNILYLKFSKKSRRKLSRYRHRRNKIWK